MLSKLYIDYRNIPLTVKVGFRPFLIREYACKDIMTVLIEILLNGSLVLINHDGL